VKEIGDVDAKDMVNRSLLPPIAVSGLSPFITAQQLRIHYSACVTTTITSGAVFLHNCITHDIAESFSQMSVEAVDKLRQLLTIHHEVQKITRGNERSATIVVSTPISEVQMFASTLQQAAALIVTQSDFSPALLQAIVHVPVRMWTRDAMASAVFAWVLPIIASSILIVH